MINEQKSITPKMVEELNIELIKEGSCFRYKEKFDSETVKAYDLIIDDKFMNNKYNYSVNYTEDRKSVV